MSRFIIYDAQGERAGLVLGNEVLPTQTPSGERLGRWLQFGVPGMRGTVAGHLIVDKPIIVKPHDPLFWLALTDHLDEIDWTMKAEATVPLGLSTVRRKSIPAYMFRGYGIKSYFQHCPRDEHGHCLPKGSAGAVKKGKPALKPKSSGGEVMGRAKTIAELAKTKPDIKFYKIGDTWKIEPEDALSEAMMEAGYEMEMGGLFHVNDKNASELDFLIQQVYGTPADASDLETDDAKSDSQDMEKVYQSLVAQMKAAETVEELDSIMSDKKNWEGIPPGLLSKISDLQDQLMEELEQTPEAEDGSAPGSAEQLAAKIISELQSAKTADELDEIYHGSEWEKPLPIAWVDKVNKEYMKLSSDLEDVQNDDHDEGYGKDISKVGLPQMPDFHPSSAIGKILAELEAAATSGDYTSFLDATEKYNQQIDKLPNVKYVQELRAYAKKQAGEFKMPAMKSNDEATQEALDDYENIAGAGNWNYLQAHHNNNMKSNLLSASNKQALQEKYDELVGLKNKTAHIEEYGGDDKLLADKLKKMEEAANAGAFTWLQKLTAEALNGVKPGSDAEKTIQAKYKQEMAKKDAPAAADVPDDLQETLAGYDKQAAAGNWDNLEKIHAGNMKVPGYSQAYKDALTAKYNELKKKTLPVVTSADISGWDVDDPLAHKSAQLIADMEMAASAGDWEGFHALGKMKISYETHGPYTKKINDAFLKVFGEHKDDYYEWKNNQPSAPAKTASALASPNKKNKFADTSAWPANAQTKFASAALNHIQEASAKGDWDTVNSWFQAALHQKGYNSSPYLQEVGKAYTQVMAEKAGKSVPMPAASLTPQPVPAPKVAEAAATTPPGGEVKYPQMTNWKETGGQLGGNPGGKFMAPDGKEYYVKFLKSSDHAKNEVLAAKLYALAGSPVPDYQLVEAKGGKLWTASPWIPSATKPNFSNALDKEAAIENFATHAWLANWDAIGQNDDNQAWVTKPDGTKQLYTMDTGGAMQLKAMGAKKTQFDNDVAEFESMLNASLAPQAAKVFGGITPQQLLASCQKVAQISDDAIKDMVEKFGPGSPAEKADLLKKLLARKKAVAAKAEQIKKALIGGDAITKTPAAASVPAAVDIGKLPVPPTAMLSSITNALNHLQELAIAGDLAGLEAYDVHEAGGGLKAKGYQDKLIESLKAQGIGAAPVPTKTAAPVPTPAAPAPSGLGVPPMPYTYDKDLIKLYLKVWNAAQTGDVSAVEAIPFDANSKYHWIQKAHKYKTQMLAAMKSGAKPNPAAKPNLAMPPTPKTPLDKDVIAQLLKLSQTDNVSALENYVLPSSVDPKTAKFKDELTAAMKVHYAAPGAAAPVPTAPAAAPPAPPTPPPGPPMPPKPAYKGSLGNQALDDMILAAEAGDLNMLEAVSDFNYEPLKNYKAQLGEWVKAKAAAPAPTPAGPPVAVPTPKAVPVVPKIDPNKFPAEPGIGGMPADPEFVSSNKANVDANNATVKKIKEMAAVGDVAGIEALDVSYSGKLKEFKSDVLSSIKDKPLLAQMKELAVKGDLAGLQALPTPASAKLQAYKNSLTEAVNDMLHPPTPPKEYHGKVEELTVVAKGANDAAIPKKVGYFMVTEDPGVAVNASWPPVNLNTGSGYALANAPLQKQYTDAYASMSKTAQKTLRDYTSGSYSIMNEALHTGKPTKELVAMTKEMIAKAPDAPIGTKLWRKLGLATHWAQLEKSVGKVLQETGVSSTSTNENVSWGGDTWFHITCGPGVKGMYVAHGISHHPGEHEMVLPPGTRYLIQSVKKKGSKMHVECIALPSVAGQCC